MTVCPLMKLSSNMWDRGTQQGTLLTDTNKQTIIKKSIIQTSLYYIFKQRHCCVSSPQRLLLAPLAVFVSALCDVTKATDTSPGLLTAPPGPCGAVQGSVVRGRLQISTSLLLLQICWPWLRKQPYRLLMPGTYVFECICMQSVRHMQGFNRGGKVHLMTPYGATSVIQLQTIHWADSLFHWPATSFRTSYKQTKKRSLHQETIKHLIKALW